ncbi:unnamed protein product [Rotaria socialis]|uniref:PH domain-containing protein n=1 Tax=Rotaria socialis TaxID=392032 RepID=A0A818HAL6_9BILA|nr:unnamed protein product [Rotaria socialis]CAF3500882.1 unnamed protein product [Rotaria socialis]CAF4202690.1 unnamed protein product [Rotaria socialis]CAF4473092.1 unnamed protein product [Rotaria socialis]
MTTTTKNSLTNNSFGFSSPKLSTAQSTCNICKRQLYLFEEILVCHLCRGAYHWRCVRPETVSIYGDNAHFLCDQCNHDGISTTTTAIPSNRFSNDGLKTKSADSLEANYRESVSTSSKSNTIPTNDTTVVTTIRYFDGNEQELPLNSMSQLNGYNEHLLSQMNGQYTDDSKTNYQHQEQKNRIGSDDENTTTEMFQATYQYTPLKEYAALRSDPTTIDTNTYVYQNSLAADSDHQLSSSRYGGSLHYTNNDYESTKSHAVISPVNNVTSATSSTTEILPVYNRQQHFISTTNLSVNDTLPRHQQQQQNSHKSSLHYSTPYLSQLRDDDSSTFKHPCQHHHHHHHQQQQFNDRYSNVGSDSGIVMVQSNHQQETKNDNKVMEKKLTDLVQKLGQQLETDTQKLSDKLETKLKNLEHMINQQTFIIREQDSVIERLKAKISKIETERDHFRDRLSIHEQREQDDKTIPIAKVIDKNANARDIEEIYYNNSPNRKQSNSSSVVTDNNRRSSKKVPAPRADNYGQISNNDNESIIARLVKNDLVDSHFRASDVSNIPMANILAACVPLTEKPAAANRLHDIIHQSNTSDTTDPTSAYYNVHPNDSKQYTERSSMGQPDTTTSIPHSDERLDRIMTSPMESNRSASPSTSSAAGSMHAITNNIRPSNPYAFPVINPNGHRSLEVLPQRSLTDAGLKSNTKAISLDLNPQLNRNNDQDSIYFTPKEAPHPASQYENVAKGWLRKQNRDSIFKRIENYYFVLSNDALLMHKHDYDRAAYKAINLKGAKIRMIEDPKHGSTLELNWTPVNKQAKQYHLYAASKEVAENWYQAIQTAITHLAEKPKWTQYRLN